MAAFGGQEISWFARGNCIGCLCFFAVGVPVCHSSKMLKNISNNLIITSCQLNLGRICWGVQNSNWISCVLWLSHETKAHESSSNPIWEHERSDRLTDHDPTSRPGKTHGNVCSQQSGCRGKKTHISSIEKRDVQSHWKTMQHTYFWMSSVYSVGLRCVPSTRLVVWHECKVANQVNIDGMNRTFPEYMRTYIDNKSLKSHCLTGQLHCCRPRFSMFFYYTKLLPRAKDHWGRLVLCTVFGIVYSRYPPTGRVFWCK